MGKRPPQNQDTEAANHSAITLHKKGPFLIMAPQHPKREGAAPGKSEPARDDRQAFTMAELEELVIQSAIATYRFPEFGPCLELNIDALEIARRMHAKAVRILNEECERVGCRPISSYEDLRRLIALRNKDGPRPLPKSVGFWGFPKRNSN